MTFRPEVMVRGNRVIKSCPVCGEDMEKAEKIGDGWVWQCTNDTCGHREEP